MSVRICVSTSEWVVINRHDEKGEVNELVTSGLCGCIAVAVESDKHICLMHVLSSLLDKHTSEDENNKILRDIELPLVVMKHRGAAAKIYYLVYNGPQTDVQRAEAISKHLEVKFPELKRMSDTIDKGCYLSGERIDFPSNGNLKMGWDWKGCVGAMNGLMQSESRTLGTWGKIGSEWQGNWELE